MVDNREGTVSVNGAELYYSTQGSGPTCLVLSAIGSEPYKRLTLPQLAEHLRLVFVDLRGSGRSTGNPADLTCVLSPCIRPPDYDTDFASTIRSQASDLGIKNFHDSCENTASAPSAGSAQRIREDPAREESALRILAVNAICETRHADKVNFMVP